MKKIFLIHPFLFALFPILFLFSHNFNQVPFSEIWLPTAAVLAMTVLLFFLGTLLLKNSQKAALATSLFLVLCFSYGHVLEVLRAWPMLEVVLRRSRYLFAFWCFLFLLVFYFSIKTRKNLNKLSVFLSLVAFFLVIIPLVEIGVYKVERGFGWQDRQRFSKEEMISTETTHLANSPDIYYIVLDRYERADNLKEIYGFDNQEFIDYLSGKGFYVATESNANYGTTHHSLASSLNMEYLDFLREKYGEDTNSLLPFFTLIEDHQIQRFLKAKDYKFFHFGSYYGPTRKNKYADVSVNFYPLPEFAMMLYKTSIFCPVGTQLRIIDFRFLQWQALQYKFDNLAETTQIPGPKFVFAHIISPHGPFVFDQNGEYLAEEEAAKRDDRDNYVNQLVFLNKEIKQLIDKLLSDPDNLPVIILQSDEGRYPARFWVEGEVFNWQEASKSELKEKMGILNAYYLPHMETKILYPFITPVNSFRLIFNLYFEAKLELLPDKSYIYADPKRALKFIEVTDKIRETKGKDEKE